MEVNGTVGIFEMFILTPFIIFMALSFWYGIFILLWN